MSERHIRNPNTICDRCSKSIYRRPCEIRVGRVFCSQKCYGISNRKESPCIVCGKPILAQFHKKTCSRSCANINRTGIFYHRGSPRDKVKSQRALKVRLLRTRGITCERCGYATQEILQVHHKNRNRDDNRLENLELICPNCHYMEDFINKNY